ncbi:hypothetical protein AMS68_005079 [Peltaster fructicola]|uniref:Major facilitator superfamily (MFS) profile domain-containing protein n=1 Tax=Peltaster fructicola TaxID=286661 RepID=A0A6H0XXR8_9PEZI|nr:hypothetical protein AMS68_005079 [Peltaster fructicola]
MDFSEIFRIVNLVAAVAMVLGGISQCFKVDVSGIIVGIYTIIFGLSTALLEFQIPPQVARYASFMFSFVGRGIFYIFIGGIIVGGEWYRYVPGAVPVLIGFGYVVLEFVPSIEPPANMREAENAGWGAEQV